MGRSAMTYALGSTLRKAKRAILSSSAPTLAPLVGAASIAESKGGRLFHGRSVPRGKTYRPRYVFRGRVDGREMVGSAGPGVSVLTSGNRTLPELRTTPPTHQRGSALVHHPAGVLDLDERRLPDRAGAATRPELVLSQFSILAVVPASQEA